MIYKACLMLIKNGRLEGLREKIELFHSKASLNDAEYAELVAMLPIEG